jgi:hypothetical protein
LLLAALGVGATACSSPGPPSSAPLVSFPSAAAKGLGRSVSVQPIPADEMVALKAQTIKDGKDSGNPTLNEGATAYLKAIQTPSNTAITSASRRIAKECERLGIPTEHFNP